MKYYKKDMAIRILKVLEEQESFSAKIAKELDSNSHSVSNYLSDLRESSLIKRSKRNQRQYYQITEKGQKYLRKVKSYKLTKNYLESELEDLE